MEVKLFISVTSHLSPSAYFLGRMLINCLLILARVAIVFDKAELLSHFGRKPWFEFLASSCCFFFFFVFFFFLLFCCFVCLFVFFLGGGGGGGGGV